MAYLCLLTSLKTSSSRPLPAGLNLTTRAGSRRPGVCEPGLPPNRPGGLVVVGDTYGVGESGSLAFPQYRLSGLYQVDLDDVRLVYSLASGCDELIAAGKGRGSMQGSSRIPVEGSVPMVPHGHLPILTGNNELSSIRTPGRRKSCIAGPFVPRNLVELAATASDFV